MRKFKFSVGDKVGCICGDGTVNDLDYLDEVPRYNVKVWVNGEMQFKWFFGSELTRIRGAQLFKPFVEEVPVIPVGVRKEGQNEDKLRMDLLDPDAMREMAQVLTAALTKYEERSWERVVRRGEAWRYVAACLRHLNAIQRGEPTDPETGKSHASHLACNAMFLVWGHLNAGAILDPQEAEGLAKMEQRMGDEPV